MEEFDAATVAALGNGETDITKVTQVATKAKVVKAFKDSSWIQLMKLILQIQLTTISATDLDAIKD